MSNPKHIPTDKTRAIAEAGAGFGIPHEAIAAGASMGVDSGLPDFRGNSGFWNAYPAVGKAEVSFIDIASPSTFYSNPQLAWVSAVIACRFTARPFLMTVLRSCGGRPSGCRSEPSSLRVTLMGTFKTQALPLGTCTSMDRFIGCNV